MESKADTIPERWRTRFEAKEMLSDGDSHNFCTAIHELGRAEAALQWLIDSPLVPYFIKDYARAALGQSGETK